MAGTRFFPGPQCACNQDWSIDDGTLVCTQSPTPGSVGITKLQSQAQYSTRATPQTYVIFFGGFRASDDDMDRWLSSARSQRPDITFKAYSYPAEKADRENAKSSFEEYDSVIKSIESSGADKIFIVGHSSGCAIADELDHRLKDNDQIVLVVLDGFTPEHNNQYRPSTQFWSAKCGEHTSLNYNKRFKCHMAKQNCTNRWALHFSLVNLAANDEDINDKNPTAFGYKCHDDSDVGMSRENVCIANLDWLEGYCPHTDE